MHRLWQTCRVRMQGMLWTSGKRWLRINIFLQTVFGHSASTPQARISRTKTTWCPSRLQNNGRSLPSPQTVHGTFRCALY